MKTCFLVLPAKTSHYNIEEVQQWESGTQAAAVMVCSAGEHISGLCLHLRTASFEVRN